MAQLLAESLTSPQAQALRQPHLAMIREQLAILEELGDRLAIIAIVQRELEEELDQEAFPLTRPR